MRRTGSLNLDLLNQQPPYKTSVSWNKCYSQLSARINFLSDDVAFWSKVIIARQHHGRPTGHLQVLLETRYLECDYCVQARTAIV
jgi:hypothetical protein